MRPGLIPTSRPPQPQSTHGYMVTTTAGPTSPLGMTTPAAAFRPAPIEPIAAIAAPTHPLTPTVLDAVAPPPLAPALPASSISLTDSDIRAVEWETVLTPRARLLLPGDQQLKFTALARRTVTVWANDRSIHVVLDRTVIRTRPSRLSEHDLRDLLSPGARIRRNRICAWCRHRRHADHQRGNRGKPHRRPWRLRRPRGCKILLDPPLEGQRVTLRFNGALMHVLARGRLVKTLPAPLEPHRRATLRGVRPGVEPLPPPAPPQRAMRRVAENGRRHGRRTAPARRTHLCRTNRCHRHRGHRFSSVTQQRRTHHAARKPDLQITRFKAYLAADRQVVHRFSLSGCDRVRRLGHQFTTVTRLRDKITSSHAPLSRVTVTASR